MAIKVIEQYKRKLSDDSAERGYLIVGAASDTAARAALKAFAPETVEGWPREESPTVDEEEGEGRYSATVKWKERDADEPEVDDDQGSFEFEVGGPSFHVQVSRGTIGRWGPGAAPGNVDACPDFKGAINVSPDRKTVDGVDLPPPSPLSFGRNYQFSKERVTTAYIRTLSGLVFNTNIAPYEDFAPGEVLFLGASGNRRGGKPWDVAMKFGLSLDAIDVPVGGTDQNPLIVVPFKAGWDILWPWAREEVDDASYERILAPAGAYVERVFERRDFDDLIPTPLTPPPTP